MVGASGTPVGFKIEALNQNGAASNLAVGPKIVNPSDNEDVAFNTIEPEVRLAGGYDLSDALSLGCNLKFAGRRGESSEECFFKFTGSIL